MLIIPEQSRGFGFLKFSSLHAARYFLERNYPTWQISHRESPNSDQETVKVRVQYSRDREDRGKGEKSDADWTCRIVCCNQRLDFLGADAVVQFRQLCGPQVVS
jgi:hypothetical protein